MTMLCMVPGLSSSAFLPTSHQIQNPDPRTLIPDP